MFDDFERVTFPKEACTVQNSRERDVLDSTETYLCVIVDSRFPTECRLEHLRPYVLKDTLKGDWFGWTRLTGMDVVDHITRSIYYDNARVVAWKRVESLETFLPEGEWREDFKDDEEAR